MSAQSLLRKAVHEAYVASLAPSARRFEQATRSPERIQLSILRRFLDENTATAYGRAHAYERCTSLADFQRRVPVVDYDALEPWVARAARGEPAILTHEPIRMFERSGGSTAANKLIPCTSSLLVQFASATEAWIHSLYRSHPHLVGSRSYWSISPAARERLHTPGGHPIGIEDDAEYFGPVGRWALSLLMAVPGSVVRLHDTDAWRRATARYLLEAEDLGLISVWHPSFLTLLLDYMAREWNGLVGELTPRRARRLRSLAVAGRVPWERVWPRLGLISCWTDAAASEFLAPLRESFPRAVIQGKGLLATEGVVSIPLPGHEGGALAVNSHFLEFMDLESPSRPPLLAHELRVGGTYSPLLTTAGGFCRYHLKDRISCTGFHNATPLVRFLGKCDATIDMCGEKLSTGLMDAAIDRAKRKTGVAPAFAMAAPDRQARPPRYVLYLESEAPAWLLEEFRAATEQTLRESQHYHYCRSLGQLDEIALQTVSDGLETWQIALAAEGARLGSLKLLSLDGRCDWRRIFGSKSSPVS